MYNKKRALSSVGIERLVTTQKATGSSPVGRSNNLYNKLRSNMTYTQPAIISRSDNWEPIFHWVINPLRCAEDINLPHEDYPDRVSVTMIELINVFSVFKDTLKLSIPNYILQDIHHEMFIDKPFAGKFRNCNVTVNGYYPPRWENVNKHMKELEFKYPNITSIEELQEWYYEFQSIHPFEDGNGRVGGVVLGAFSRIIRPKNKLWLAPGQ